MELILSPDFWDDVGRQETGADTSRQETDAGISIKLPPGYPDHDPRTALPPIFCRFGGGGGYMTWGRFIRHVAWTSRVQWLAWQHLGQVTRDRLSADWELI